MVDDGEERVADLNRAERQVLEEEFRRKDTKLRVLVRAVA